MKRLSRSIIAVVLAILVMTIMPAQVFADSLPEYISEVKVYIGSYSNAEKEGFKILNGDNGNPVDLNQGAGGGLGSEGDKAVYLGYKTTTKSDEAITDLALMNMKGGYSVQEYEALMEAQMNSQILPFITGFRKTIDEYRLNYNSDDSINRQRAEFVYNALNKLVDDDTGKGMDDLLLNTTKQEMGDETYNALSDEQKKEHADLATIVAQSNGKATILMFNLLTRASDPNDTSWLERFEGMSYDDLVEYTGMLPTDAENELEKLYDDDAQLILSMWDDFREQLLNADRDAEDIEKIEDEDIDSSELDEKQAALADNADAHALAEVMEAVADSEAKTEELAEKASNVAVAEYLKSIDYLDGTMYDFFTMPEEEIADDITVLYPLVASLSDGQRAGLEFVSLKELVIISERENDYGDADLDVLKDASIYEGVDRGIYQKGGVALTSDALRKDAALNEQTGDGGPLSGLTIAFIALTAVSTAGFVGSMIAKGIFTLQLRAAEAAKTTLNNAFITAGLKYNGLVKPLRGNFASYADYSKALSQYETANTAAFSEYSAAAGNVTRNNEFIARTTPKSAMSGRLAAGFGVAMIVIAAITTYLTWRDMQAYYKVDFTPIPHYMVDEKDLTGYNSKGEKIILKNQTAYYKAVESNAQKGDFKFDEIGNLADMNGCVGKQWLALYAVKNESMDPILASSLKVVVGSTDVPSGYTTGIHMFGSEAAFNLNSSLYDWNNSAPAVHVYFKTDEGAVSTSGTNFTGGTLALTGGAGLALGALATAFAKKSSRNKKDAETEE